MSKFFAVDNPIFNAISRVGDMFMLSVLWLLTSLPIITIGASTTALCDISIKIIRGRDTGIIKPFLISFKNNFKQSTIIWLVMLPIGILLALDIKLCLNMTQSFAVVILGISVELAILFVAMFLYIFPIQAVFDNPIKANVRNVFLMATKHIGNTFLLLVVSAGLLYLCYLTPIVLYVMLMIGVGAFALIYAVRFLSIFMKYNETLKPDSVEIDEFDKDAKKKAKKERVLLKHKGKIIK